MLEETNGLRNYTLKWKFEPRIRTEHFGISKYATTGEALRELVANALAAEATHIAIDFVLNPLGGYNSIDITDDGYGISPEILVERFMHVGCEPQPNASRSFLGRFGIGRLAVHRIGTRSDWQSISKKDGKLIAVSFSMSTDTAASLKVREEPVADGVATGTTIRIVNLRDETHRTTEARIAAELLAYYCSYLLANPGRDIRVAGEPLDVRKMISRADVDEIPATMKIPCKSKMTHLLLQRPIENTCFRTQMIFSAKGRTVATFQPDNPPAPNYLAIVECEHLDTLVTADRDALVEMDDSFNQLKNEALKRMAAFSEKVREILAQSFIERARKEEFYPYRNRQEDNPIESAQQAVFDVVLEKVNENANIERMTKRQQEIVFMLLKRGLDNEDLLVILQEVAKLADDDMQKFRKVLERTTLESIVKLSNEVTARIQFLNNLEEVVYGGTSKFVRERTHLHKLIEANCWIFGAHYHLATSDQGFRTVIRRHRQEAGLSDITDEQLAKIQGIDDIPDLFLAATREHPDGVMPRYHHCLIEIKAPKVAMGDIELAQIRRYADTILDAPELDKKATRWELFLVSGRPTTSIERMRTQESMPFGQLLNFPAMKVWALQWSEIIERARSELTLVRNHLELKSRELNARDSLREQFPNVVRDMDQRAQERGGA